MYFYRLRLPIVALIPLISNTSIVHLDPQSPHTHNPPFFRPKPSPSYRNPIPPTYPSNNPPNNPLLTEDSLTTHHKALTVLLTTISTTQSLISHIPPPPGLDRGLYETRRFLEEAASSCSTSPSLSHHTTPLLLLSTRITTFQNTQRTRITTAILSHLPPARHAIFKAYLARAARRDADILVALQAASVSVKDKYIRLWALQQARRELVQGRSVAVWLAARVGLIPPAIVHAANQYATAGPSDAMRARFAPRLADLVAFATTLADACAVSDPELVRRLVDPAVPLLEAHVDAFLAALDAALLAEPVFKPVEHAYSSSGDRS